MRGSDSGGQGSYRYDRPKETFDPDDITKSDMKYLADHIEEYIMVLEEVMIIPDEIMDKEDQIKDAIKTVKKLIKKLREGDTGVFKDKEEWNLIG